MVVVTRAGGPAVSSYVQLGRVGSDDWTRGEKRTWQYCVFPSSSVVMSRITAVCVWSILVAVTRTGAVVPGLNGGTTVSAFVDFKTTSEASPLPTSWTVMVTCCGGPAVSIALHVGFTVSAVAADRASDNAPTADIAVRMPTARMMRHATPLIAPPLRLGSEILTPRPVIRNAPASGRDRPKRRRRAGGRQGVGGTTTVTARSNAV